MLPHGAVVIRASVRGINVSQHIHHVCKKGETLILRAVDGNRCQVWNKYDAGAPDYGGMCTGSKCRCGGMEVGALRDSYNQFVNTTNTATTITCRMHCANT